MGKNKFKLFLFLFWGWYFDYLILVGLMCLLLDFTLFSVLCMHNFEPSIAKLIHFVNFFNCGADFSTETYSLFRGKNPFF